VDACGALAFAVDVETTKLGLGWVKRALHVNKQFVHHVDLVTVSVETFGSIKIRS
jgi:hypothetical protein